LCAGIIYLVMCMDKSTIAMIGVAQQNESERITIMKGWVAKMDTSRMKMQLNDEQRVSEDGKKKKIIVVYCKGLE
jgi:hypothetical protein